MHSIMNEHGILVFPGFEIAFTEKAHFVGLFPEDTSRGKLNWYLDVLGLTNPANGVWPHLGGNDLLSKVEDVGGFVYAALCTDEGGILRQKVVHVWKKPLLKAVLIPDTFDKLKNEGVSYCQILLNHELNYERKLRVAIDDNKKCSKARRFN